MSYHTIMWVSLVVVALFSTVVCGQVAGPLSISVNINGVPMQVTIDATKNPQDVAQAACLAAFVGDDSDTSVIAARRDCVSSLAPLIARKQSGDFSFMANGVITVPLAIHDSNLEVTLTPDTNVLTTAEQACDAGVQNGTTPAGVRLCVSQVTSHLHETMRTSFHLPMRQGLVAAATMPLDDDRSFQALLHEGDSPVQTATNVCRQGFPDGDAATLQTCVARVAAPLTDLLLSTLEARFGPVIAQIPMQVAGRQVSLVLNAKRSAQDTCEAFGKSQGIPFSDPSLRSLLTTAKNTLAQSAAATAYKYCDAAGLGRFSPECVHLHAELVLVSDGGGRTRPDRLGLANALRHRAPMKLLVWGVRWDSVAWADINKDGTTTFIEDVYAPGDPRGEEVALIERMYPQLNILRHAFDHEAPGDLAITGEMLVDAMRNPDEAIDGVEEGSELEGLVRGMVRDCGNATNASIVNSTCPLAQMAPDVLKSRWDVILVDGPASFRHSQREAASRLTPIYLSALSALQVLDDEPSPESMRVQVVVQDYREQGDRDAARTFLCEPAMAGGNLAVHIVTPGTEQFCTKLPRIAARHILVVHKDARHPTSWRVDNVNITRDEAMERILELRSRVIAGADFAEVARNESDCSSHEVGGNLGTFGPGNMHKGFEKGAYALEVGEMSGVVESKSGLHLILRTK